MSNNTFYVHNGILDTYSIVNLLINNTIIWNRYNLNGRKGDRRQA
jgi:hypothetical protein